MRGEVIGFEWVGGESQERFPGSPPGRDNMIKFTRAGGQLAGRASDLACRVRGSPTTKRFDADDGVILQR